MRRPYPAFAIFLLIFTLSVCFNLLFGLVILDNKNTVTHITKYLTTNSIPSSVSELKTSILLSNLRQEFERSLFTSNISLQNESAYNIEKIRRAINDSGDEKSITLVTDAIALIENKNNITLEITSSNWTILDSVIEKYIAQIRGTSLDEIAEKLAEVENTVEKDAFNFKLFTGLLITLQTGALIAIFRFFVEPLKTIEKSIHADNKYSTEEIPPEQHTNSKIKELSSLQSAINKLHLTTTENMQMRDKINIELENAKNIAEEKSEFLSSMSHEINTPLSSLIIVIYLLEQTDADETQKSYIQRLTQSANYLSTLIERVLKMSRMDASKLELEIIPFDISEVVDEVYSILEPISSKKHLKFRTHIDNSIPPLIMGDRLNTKEIILNFASNAIKFTSSGEVRIDIRSISTGIDTIEIRIAVTDTGRGIAAKDLSMLFQRFSQVKKKTFAGTGLGLAITKGLTELMSGYVSVESKEGIGSTFSANIPYKLPRVDELATNEIKYNQQKIVIENSYDTPAINDADTQNLLKKIYSHANNDLPEAVAIWIKNEEILTRSIGAGSHEIGNKLKKFNLQHAANQIKLLLTDRKEEIEINVGTNRQKPTILIIDDTPGNLDLFNLLLTDFATIKVTSIPDRGIEIAKNCRGICLIILDIMMPLKDGYEVLNELKGDASTSDIPVIMVSASESHDTRSRCLASGAAEFIDRNKTPEKIEAIVRKYVHNVALNSAT